MNRRTFISTATAVAGVAATASAAQRPPVARTDARNGEQPSDNAKFQIGMIIFDQMTNLDFVGPCDAFARIRQANVTVLGKTLAPITTDAKHRVLADATLADAPELDMLFVPGGPGTTAMMEDPEVLAFLRARAPRAQWVTSVCTGALVLGAAGLLKGYQAATHWASMELLEQFGATPVSQRVVIDRNRVTGGGVTAGIDFALTLIARLWGEETAKTVQLGMEYNPKPPFDAGEPDRVPEIAAHYLDLIKPMQNARVAAVKRAAARLS
jgi:cyclohexyl-isocyanide hydratase